MGRAREILLGLLGAFREAMPGAEFREALDARESFRPAGRVWVLGSVQKESEQGDQWSAKLAFTVYGPGGDGVREVLDGMIRTAKDSQPLLSGVESGPGAKGAGAVAAGCVLSFFKPGSAGGSGGTKVTYPVEIDGAEYTVTGWKAAGGAFEGGLTAIGESEPFYYRSGGEFTVELQGLSLERPEELEGFTLRLGDQRVMYTGCRWKSLSAGGSGVLAAGGRIALEGE